MLENNNSQYLRHITELGNKHPISASEDIHNSQGVKLVKAGSRIDSSFYDKLLKHKLLKPIDQSLIIENCITLEALESKMVQQITENPLLYSMKNDILSDDVFHAVISNLNIPDILLFKLTISEKQLPDIFKQSLHVSIASIYFGLKLKLDIEKLKVVAIAGLFHDIGLLHLEADLFNTFTPLDEDKRKHIYSHPIIAHLILKEFQNYQEASLAVLEHHERMDGSGYPKNLSAEQISLSGQILIVAALAISLTQQKSDFSYKNRLQAILKFNSNQYPHKIVEILLNLLKNLQDDNKPSAKPQDKDAFLDTLSSIWTVINAWEPNHNKTLQVPHKISNYISQRIEELTHALNMSGLTLDYLSLPSLELEEILKDSEELLALLNEATYQIKNISHEITRRWPEITIDNDVETSITQWLNSLQTFLTESDSDHEE